MATDYRVLLKKYMAFVIQEVGEDFAGRILPVGAAQRMDVAEIDALREISDEVYVESG